MITSPEKICFLYPREDEPDVDVIQEYGEICTKCNELYEHVEKQENFICYGCKQWL